MAVQRHCPYGQCRFELPIQIVPRLTHTVTAPTYNTNQNVISILLILIKIAPNKTLLIRPDACRSQGNKATTISLWHATQLLFIQNSQKYLSKIYFPVFFPHAILNYVLEFISTFYKPHVSPRDIFVSTTANIKSLRFLHIRKNLSPMDSHSLKKIIIRHTLIYT